MSRAPIGGGACPARRLLLLLGAVGLALAPAAARADARASIERGDRAWAARAASLDGQRARPERIEAAAAAYREALAERPDSAEAAWKLMRALHYAVDFTTIGAEQEEARLEEAVTLAREWVDRIDDEATEVDATDAERARILFWSAIVWGARAQRAGLLTIVREGVADRMRDGARRARALDPGIDGGGPMRLLSRLHATLPRVPFVSGWVDRSLAIPLAEEAWRVDRGHPGNALVLALAILDVAPERRDEARRLLEGIRRGEPRPDAVVEDLVIQEEAEEALASLREGA
jgi:hypothetical protein